MMKSVVLVAALCSFAGAAYAQGAKPITFECSYNSRANQVEILGNNPNPVLRTGCKVKCTYTNKEKQSPYVECSGNPVNVGTKKFVCGDKPKGTAPYSGFKISGGC